LFAGAEAHKTLANPLEPNRALYLSLLQQGGDGTYKNKNNITSRIGKQTFLQLENRPFSSIGN
jgi:hypothetical protein